MKKALIALMVVATAWVAQANVWNVNWTIMGAMAPDDPGDMSVSLFENYGITWDLINATAGDTVIESASLINGSLSWDDTKNGGYKAEYTDNLILTSPFATYLGSTELSTEQSIYQKITLVSNETGDEYVWEGERFAVTPAVDGSKPAMDLDVSVAIAPAGVIIDGATMATWTKTTTIPEPATMSLLGLGALAMVLRRRIRR